MEIRILSNFLSLNINQDSIVRDSVIPAGSRAGHETGQVLNRG